VRPIKNPDKKRLKKTAKSGNQWVSIGQSDKQTADASQNKQRPKQA